MERLADAVVDVVAEPRLRGEMLRDELLRAIQDGRLAPGERLDEVRIARRFGVSRTPVREALRQLAAVNLVEIRPHRGAVVAGGDRGAANAVAEAMAEVAAVCARLAASRRSPADTAMLRARHAAWTASFDSDDANVRRQAAMALEEGLGLAAMNPTLARIVGDLGRRLARAEPARGEIEAAAETLVAAIDAGDPAAAEAAARRWLAAFAGGPEA